MSIQLVPPDAKSNQSGPTELYFIVGESAEGIARPDDPRVVQYFESQLLNMFPFMRRTGSIEQIKTSGGDGALIAWDGQNPTGMNIRAYIFVSLIKGYGIALVGLGDKNVIDTRKPILQDMFSSFGIGQSQIDPVLVGNWRYEDNYSSGEFIGITVRYMSLRQDGSFDTSGRVVASMESDDAYGNPIGSTHADTGTSPGDRGRWGTGNKKLYLMWDDGSYAEYGYYIEGAAGGRKMLLKPANGKNELWYETR